jgi:nicotinamide riboside kinase
MHTIGEVARNVLSDHNFTRDDLTIPQRAIQLQRLILEAQYKAEIEHHPEGMILCDRSGIDPLAYSCKYGPPGDLASVMGPPAWAAWQVLKPRMQTSLVILCHPRTDWVVDDGTRLMAKDWEEWQDLLRIFKKLLAENEIPYYSIPNEISSSADRVNYVLTLWTSMSFGMLS